MNFKSLLLFSVIFTTTSTTLNALDITPTPVSVKEGKNMVAVSEATPVIFNVPSGDEIRLKKDIDENGIGLKPSEHNYPETAAIVFTLTDSLPGVSSPEGYRLQINDKGITVTATGGAGLFYGLQTLRQLSDGKEALPEVDITDYPRFAYRGMMLDISRHWRDKEFIKKQIDAIAKLKVNRLHLHLTDAAGWRIEITQYPELTEYAAWRPAETWKEWRDGGNRYISHDSPFAHGGFLTREDVKEIVDYAADRYITVIPEIEMPSHSEEVTATYPWLACSGEVQPDLCVGNEKTFEFLQNVLDEVMEIFPSQYIHIGGDEASKEAWKECELCLARMKENNLNNVDQLQSYLIHRIEDYVNSKGRSIIGWDEIIDGGLAPNATVMSWRGVEGGIKAANSRHKAIMTPGGYCYLDSYQDAPPTQPEALSGYLPLSKVYSYNPAPDSLPASVKQWIEGVQGNLWCEYVPTAQHAEYMLYPRMIAIAEIGWSPQEKRDWEDFYPRAMKINDGMQRGGYHVFDLKGEVGERREALIDVDHLGRGKMVTYNLPWWDKYNAAYEKTLTDGKRGSWTYGDGVWQGFERADDKRVDVTIDLEELTDISYIGAEFMQITGPWVWFPTKVVISVSDDGVNYRTLKEIDHQQKDTSGLSFKTYAWEGKDRARYVRYVADSTLGCTFTDEIIIY